MVQEHPEAREDQGKKNREQKVSVRRQREWKDEEQRCFRDKTFVRTHSQSSWVPKSLECTDSNQVLKDMVGPVRGLIRSRKAFVLNFERVVSIETCQWNESCALL